MKALKFGLIGKSLAHSFSAEYFNDKFRRDELPHHYDLFPLSNIEDFPALLSSRKNLRGLNVTIPYKESILRFLDALSPEAAEIGAVNTILIQDGKTTGYNTDAEGFSLSLDRFFPIHQKQNTLILGTGGAAKAVAHALKKDRPESEIHFASRNPQKRNEIAYDALHAFDFSNVALIINSTPAGMYPEVNTYPDIPYTKLNPAHFLFDLIYNPSETVFMQKGKEQGCKTENGMNMLLNQAEAAWKIWQADRNE